MKIESTPNPEAGGAVSDRELSRRRLNVLLAARGWLHRDLACAIGVEKQTITGVAAGIDPTRKTRHRIEKFFNVAIWHTEEEWTATKRAEARLGLDPIISPIADVRSRARALGIISSEAKPTAPEIIALAAKLPDDFKGPAVPEKTPLLAFADGALAAMPCPVNHQFSALQEQMNKSAEMAADSISKFRAKLNPPATPPPDFAT